MSYQVIYEEGSGKRQKRIRFRRFPLTIVAFFAFLLLVNIYWARGQEVLREFLLPQEVETAVEVFNDFASNLRSGEGFPVALREFFYELLH